MGDLKDFHGGKVLELARKQGLRSRDFLDFSANISPFGMDERIKKVIYNSIDDLIFYPETDYDYIYYKLANLHKTDKEFIRLGNGAIDIIYKIAHLLSLKSYLYKNKKKILIVDPSFIEYRKAFVEYKNLETIYYDMDVGSLKLDEKIIASLSDDLLAVFICNPNNPSSSLVDENILRKIVGICKDKNIYCILDECFMDFIEEEEKYSLVQCIQDNENLIILRSFTKLFAIAGLRLGYFLSSNKEFLSDFDRISQTWNINTLALRVGEVASEIYEEIKAKNIEIIEEERRYLLQELSTLGIKIYASKANFILLRIDKMYDELEEYLLKRRILIRSCANYRGLDKRYYRIAIRKHEENIELIKALKEYFK